MLGCNATVMVGLKVGAGAKRSNKSFLGDRAPTSENICISYIFFSYGPNEATMRNLGVRLGC